MVAKIGHNNNTRLKDKGNVMGGWADSLSEGRLGTEYDRVGTAARETLGEQWHSEAPEGGKTLLCLKNRETSLSVHSQDRDGMGRGMILVFIYSSITSP